MNEFLGQIYTAVLPPLVLLLGTLLGHVIAKAAAAAQERWGIEIEARHREALHSAIMSGIRAALGRKLSGTAAIDAAISYAAISVPDAMVKLAPSRAILTDLAGAKLREALGDIPLLDLGSTLDAHSPDLKPQTGS